MFNQIAVRVVLLMIFAVSTHDLGQGNIVEHFHGFDKDIKLETDNRTDNRKKVMKKHQTRKMKTHEDQPKELENPEKKKEGKKIENWLEELPKIKKDSKAADFINTVSPIAVVIAEEKGIYPSVMIAQAGIESGWGSSNLAKKYNNLMGTKSSEQGDKVSLETSEEVAGEAVEINAGFSIYNSWGESLTHYGKMMRDGLEWDSDYYKGTWRENTESYKDATAYLVGRYASDSSYAEKLNSTIKKYDLDRFDQVDVIDFDYEKALTEATVEI